MSWQRKEHHRWGCVLAVAALCVTALLGSEVIAHGTDEPRAPALAPGVGAVGQAPLVPRRACRRWTRPHRAHPPPIGRFGLHVLAHRGREPHANLRIAGPARSVALSFDDGPTPAYTPAILRLLRRARAHATFFVVGAFALGHPGILRQEASAGDEIANHTFDHEELTYADGSLRVPRSNLRTELELTDQAICQAGVPEPALFRPPYGRGLFNAEIAQLSRRHGEQIIGWNLALDRFLSRHHGITAAVGSLLASVRPGSIILLHDGIANRQTTVRALPMLLAGLSDRGYRTTTISALLRSGRLATSSAGRAIRNNPRAVAAHRPAHRRSAPPRWSAVKGPANPK